MIGELADESELLEENLFMMYMEMKDIDELFRESESKLKFSYLLKFFVLVAVSIL